MDKEAADALIVEHRRLPYAVANLVARRNSRWDSVDDLVGVASVAMVEAAYSYEEGHGATFRTWVISMMKHRLNDYFRREHKEEGGRGAPKGQFFASRIVEDIYRADEAGDLMQFPLPGVDEPGYEAFEDIETEIAVLCDFIVWVKDRLNERDYDLFITWMEVGRLKVAGEEFGVSESRASQIVKEVLGLAKEYGQTVLDANEREQDHGRGRQGDHLQGDGCEVAVASEGKEQPDHRDLGRVLRLQVQRQEGWLAGDRF